MHFGCISLIPQTTLVTSLNIKNIYCCGKDFDLDSAVSAGWSTSCCESVFRGQNPFKSALRTKEELISWLKGTWSVLGVAGKKTVSHSRLCSIHPSETFAETSLTVTPKHDKGPRFSVAQIAVTLLVELKFLSSKCLTLTLIGGRWTYERASAWKHRGVHGHACVQDGLK